jgi:hypothetical protein
MHYHGLPVTPLTALAQLGGCNFCVSYAAPHQVTRAHELGQSVMLDNGAFSFWRIGKATDWQGYYAWAEPWLEYPTTWAVIPDVIDGTTEDNDHLLAEWAATGLPKGAPVWHMHEPLARLARLCAGYERVCLGSSGKYAQLGSVGWHRRMEAAMNTACADSTPWLHMLRGMAFSGSRYPFASVDSTDIARNHNRPQNTPVAMARRWDRMQCPARWVDPGQESMFDEEAA